MAIMEDIDLLGLFVASDEAADEVLTHVLYPRGDGSAILLNERAWPEGIKAPSQHQIDDLERHGWVHITKREGNGRTFGVTGAGRQGVGSTR